ncbi:Fe-S cluster assembly protein SufD [Myxosarcina sp. GI1]|uniref:Fe-S cluster assembly protein SufD n=1 Tax=Myxosarcina sp. GI1 TaxID=1541065 RepID=UPI0005659BF8|nr:Fe-S cluster assembly protein SufD [Myxosarcina sp. GI1]
MAVQVPYAIKPLKSDRATLHKNDFLMGLLDRAKISGNEPQWLKDVRQQAASWVANSSVPTKKDEDWRFIDLSDLTKTNFTTVGANGGSPLPQLPTETENCRLIFVNGVYNADLSDTSALPDGVYVGSLQNIPETYPVAEHFARQHGAQDVFTALNTAGFANAAVIWANKNVIVDTPIHLVFISTAEETASFSQLRTLVVAEAGASLSLIEEYSGTGEYFINAVTEIVVRDNAEVKHTRWQQESDRAFHVGKTAVAQAKDSRYTLNEINFGSKLYRHNPEVLQQGEQTTTNLNGLTVATGEQTSDTHSTIALTKPYGTTDQLHKCIVGDRAHTVFNGKVFVPKTAQLTDASQLNRNLLLSDKARVDTKPELQITADNVKCSHGATVSQLEADEIFYLRSRGLNQQDASQLLIDAFAGEIGDRLPLNLAAKVAQTIKQKISK